MSFGPERRISEEDFVPNPDYKEGEAAYVRIPDEEGATEPYAPIQSEEPADKTDSPRSISSIHYSSVAMEEREDRLAGV